MCLDRQQVLHIFTPAPPAFAWTRRHRSSICVVDCMLVQSVSCGHSLLTAPVLDGTFNQICENLAALFLRGWQPPIATGDPVLWQRRCHNLAAGGLANRTMDAQESWFRTLDWPFEVRAWKIAMCKFTPMVELAVTVVRLLLEF